MPNFPKVQSRLLDELEAAKNPQDGFKEYPPTEYVMRCDRFIQKIYYSKGEKEAINFEIFYYNDNVSIVGSVETEVANCYVRNRISFHNDMSLRDALYMCNFMSNAAIGAGLSSSDPVEFWAWATLSRCLRRPNRNSTLMRWPSRMSKSEPN